MSFADWAGDRRGFRWMILALGVIWILVEWRRPYHRQGAVFRMLDSLPDPAAAAAAPALGEGVDTVRLTAEAALQLRDFAVRREFDSVESRLADLEDQAGRTVDAEFALYDAYTAGLSGPGRALGGALEKWVGQRPASPRARLAHAAWSIAEGFRARGGGSAEDETDDQRARFSDFVRAARADVHAALAQDPRSIAAYWIATDLAEYAGDPGGAALAMHRALLLSPRSFLTRARAEVAMVPRWGGNYEMMREVARDAPRDSNPEFASLGALVDWDQADVAWRHDDLRQALRLLNDAIAVAPNWWLLKRRGEILEREDSSVRALDDLREAIALRPAIVDLHYWISYAEWEVAAIPGTRNWPALMRAAVTDIHLADALDPTYRDTPLLMRKIDAAAARSGITIP